MRNYHITWEDADGWHASHEPYDAEQLTWFLNHQSVRDIEVKVRTASKRCYLCGRPAGTVSIAGRIVHASCFIKKELN